MVTASRFYCNELDYGRPGQTGQSVNEAQVMVMVMVMVVMRMKLMAIQVIIG